VILIGNGNQIGRSANQQICHPWHSARLIHVAELHVDQGVPRLPQEVKKKIKKKKKKNYMSLQIFYMDVAPLRSFLKENLYQAMKPSNNPCALHINFFLLGPGSHAPHDPRAAVPVAGLQ
jgi:hypothetical protein